MTVRDELENLIKTTTPSNAEVAQQLADQLRNEPEAMALVMQVMMHQRDEAHWLREQIENGLTSEVKRLKAENDALHHELDSIKRNIYNLLYVPPPELDDEPF